MGPSRVGASKVHWSVEALWSCVMLMGLLGLFATFSKKALWLIGSLSFVALYPTYVHEVHAYPKDKDITVATVFIVIFLVTILIIWRDANLRQKTYEALDV